MRVLLALIVLALCLWAIVTAVQKIAGAIRSRRLSRQPWELVEESKEEAVAVYAYKPGAQKLIVGYAPFASMDFDSKLWELRAEGREKVAALNEGKTVIELEREV